MKKTINYHDTDAIGIVYYGVYINFIEESCTRFFEEKGVAVKNMHEKGEYFVIKTLKADYKSPARYGDSIVCNTKISKITSAQIYFSQIVSNNVSGQILMESEVILVVVNKHLKPILLPEKVDLLLHEKMEV